MSVDKFGRTSKRGLTGHGGEIGPKGPQGEGFYLTKNGDYDLKLKRIQNLGNPFDNNDSVTKEYADKEIKRLEESLRELNIKISEEIGNTKNDVQKSIENVNNDLKILANNTDDKYIKLKESYDGRLNGFEAFLFKQLGRNEQSVLIEK